MYSDNPIISRIQSWLIRLESKHRQVQFCWVPSHIDIKGNEQADKLAKDITRANTQPAYIHYSHRDYYSLVKKTVGGKWQSK